MKIPKLAKGGVIKIPVISSKSTEDLYESTRNDIENKTSKENNR